MRRAFTIIELIVTITIVGILIGLLIPAIQTVREAGRRTVCLNNMRQVALGIHSYESSHNQLPPTLSNQLINWQAQCLPYLGQNPIYQEVKDGLKTIHPYYSPFFSESISAFQCSSNPDIGSVIEADGTGAVFAFTDYCGVAGSDEVIHDGIFPFRPAIPIRFREVSGGLSNTFMFGERPPNPIAHGTGMWLGSQWTVGATMSVTNDGNIESYPEDCGALRFQNGIRFNNCGAFHHWSYHPGGGHFARADGSVAFASYDIDTELLKELGSRN